MLEIAKRAFINYIRNKKTMLTFILFPIILMSLLGVLLNSAFSNTKTINTANLYYYSQNASNESKEIITILKDTSSKANISLKPINSIEAGKNEVKLNDASFVIFNNNNIDVYNNIENTIDSTMVNEYLSAIIKSTNAIEESLKINPIATQKALSTKDNSKSEVEIITIPKENQISSYAYYAIAELSLFGLYIAIAPILAIDYDERKSIRERLKLAGISDLKYYLGNSIGYFFVSIILTLPGYLFAEFALGVDFKNFFISYGSLLLLTIVSVLLGQVVSITFNNAQKASNILKVAIFPILAFLGGAYTPISQGVTNISPFLDILTKISPLRWLNLGLTNYITNGSYNDLIINTAIDIVLIVIFILLLIVISKRKEKI